MTYGYDRSKDPRADKVFYDALAPASPKALLNGDERARRAFNWLSYSAVVKFKNGDEDVVTVQALNEDDARYRVGLRLTKSDKIINIYTNGEAW